jgi:chromosome segregation ATPase
LESDLRAQLSAAQAAAAQAIAAIKEEAARSNQSFEEQLQRLRQNLKQEQLDGAQKFERELAQLQQSRDELLAKLTTEQLASTEAKARNETLEQQSRESLAKLERVQAELVHHTGERAGLESDLRAQLDAARTATAQAEAARSEAAERSKRAEEELAGVRQERHELQEKFTAEQQTAAEFKRRSDEFENKLRENVTELETVKAEQTRQSE